MTPLEPWFLSFGSDLLHWAGLVEGLAFFLGECDSSLVVQAFSKHSLVPWSLRNGWLNCLNLVSKMNFRVFHICREGNSCVNKLANHGFSVPSFTWWESVPNSCKAYYKKNNRLGLPNYRFCWPTLPRILVLSPHVFIFLSFSNNILAWWGWWGRECQQCQSELEPRESTWLTTSLN